MKKIEFGNLGWQYAQIKDSVEDQISMILESGNYVSGLNVSKFESEFAKFTGSDFGICVNSGTSALHSALLATGVGVGDEVICPSHTFIATATAIVMAGATPVLVDVDQNGLMDHDSALNAVTRKTKAIIPVHLYGSLVDTAMIEDFKNKGMVVIEDASQAHGARYANGDHIGKYSDVATYSFYPGKNLGAAGEGGACTTSLAEVNKSLRLIRNWGSEVRYKHDVLGFNYRMDEIQSVILSAKLQHMSDWNETRRMIAARYILELKKLPITIVNNTDGNSVFHQFVIHVEKREELQEYLLANGVVTQIHYPVPIHQQKALKDFVRLSGKHLKTEELTKGILSLPIYPGLDAESVEYVIKKIIEFYAKP
jgi:dTDP-4-amino-4,6-dideoxygalactose transaminase